MWYMSERQLLRNFSWLFTQNTPEIYNISLDLQDIISVKIISIEPDFFFAQLNEVQNLLL